MVARVQAEFDLPEGKSVFFASDLHLGAPNAGASAERERAFVAWMDSVKPRAAALYLVGDVFDFWFEYQHAIPKGFARLQGRLAQWSDEGIPIYTVKEFAKSFGAPAAPIASAEAPKPAAQAQKFEDVVAAKATELKGDKSSAISFAVKHHADLYAVYRARVQGGELVKL